MSVYRTIGPLVIISWDLRIWHIYHDVYPHVTVKLEFCQWIGLLIYLKSLLDEKGSIFLLSGTCYFSKVAQWGGSNADPPSLFWAKKREKYHFFHLKITILTAVKYCSILHDQVCTMTFSDLLEQKNLSVITSVLEALGGWPILGEQAGGKWNVRRFDLVALLVQLAQYGIQPIMRLNVVVDSKTLHSIFYK